MKLKSGEIICPKCKGSGNQADWMHLPDYKVYMNCVHCNGIGKLDWIEAAVGVKPKLIERTSIKPRNRKLKEGWTISCT